MSSLSTENLSNFEINEEVVCPLIINGKYIKDNGFNIPTLGVVISINNNYITVKYNIFKSINTFRFDQLEKKLVDINGEDFYIRMMEKSKKFNKTFDYRFYYGPSAANLYYLENGIDYCLTFDYEYHGLYLAGISNILKLDLNNISTEQLSQLNEPLKILFKNMVKEMIFRTEDFTFSDVSNLIIKLKSLIEFDY